jgi:hypothetical protein
MRKKLTTYIEEVNIKKLKQIALDNNCSVADIIDKLTKKYLKGEISMEDYAVAKYKDVQLELKFDESENVYYRNPTSGQWNETIDQAYAGWSEQDEDLNQQWDELKKCVQDDDNLGAKIVDLDEIEY